MACSEPPPTTATPPVPVSFRTHTTVVISAGVAGELGPCGARGALHGGVDERAALINGIAGPKLVIDAGDHFFREVDLSPAFHASGVARAFRLAEGLKAAKTNVIVPGPLDFALGATMFRALAVRSGAVVVAADRVGFPPFAIVDGIGIAGVVSSTASATLRAAIASAKAAGASPVIAFGPGGQPLDRDKLRCGMHLWIDGDYKPVSPGAWVERPSPRQPKAGMSACKNCHPEAYSFWKRTPHARSMASLRPVRQSQNRDCTPCHATVGCQACHGSSLAHVRTPTVSTHRVTSDAVCHKCHMEQADQHAFRTEDRMARVLGGGHGGSR